MVGAISTSKGDIRQLFQLDQLLHKDEERLEGDCQVIIQSLWRLIQGLYIPDDDRATSAEILHLRPFLFQFSP